MPVPELAKFREKYPGYNDIDDATLASKLAAKYPDSYGDLPSKVKSAGRKTYSKSETERMRREFVDKEGTVGTRIKEHAKTIGKTLAPYARPVLEGGGAAIGGIIGGTAGGVGGLAGGPAAPATVPYGAIAGGVAGGATGYATGKYLADVMEGAPQSAGQTVQDLATGATYEMGGQVGAHVAGKVLTGMAGPLKKAANSIMRNTPAITQTAINRKAGQIIAENSGAGTVYENNAKEAAKLNIPGYKPSLGEARNDPGLIKLQRGIASSPGKASNTILEKQAKNTAAQREYLANEFKGGESIDDVVDTLQKKKAGLERETAAANKKADAAKEPLDPSDPSTVGSNIADEIDAALEPVKTTEREAWSKVPNYPIPATHLSETASQIRSTPMESDTEAAVNKILDFADRMPKNTEGMQSIERTINDKMYAPNADPNTRRILGQLKKAVGEDFKSMGDAADNGDIALHNGSVVFPSKLKSELADTEKRIAEEESKVPDGAGIDIKKTVDALKERGLPFMRQNRESDTAFAGRVAKDYERAFKQKPPVPEASPNKYLDNLKANKAKIQSMLENLQPAEDVASAYKSAKEVSADRFKRFGSDAVGDILKQGKQSTGRNLSDTAIAKRIFNPNNPESADSFIRAVGKKKAAAHADQYAANELLTKINPVTGELKTKDAAAWLKKNMALLRKYGISEKYSTIAKMQDAVDIAKQAETEFSKSAASKVLNADVDKAVASAFSSNPSNTGAVIDDLMKQIGKDSKATKGLQNAVKDFIISKAETTAKTIAGENIISPAAIQKELAKYGPALRKLYAKEPEKIAALNKVAKAIEIQARSAKPPTGGPGTSENLNMARAIMGKVVDMVPGVNWATKLGRIGLAKLNELNGNELNELIARALYDPELAQTLKLASERYKPEVVERRINSHLVTMGIAGMSGATVDQKTEPSESEEDTTEPDPADFDSND